MEIYIYVYTDGKLEREFGRLFFQESGNNIKIQRESVKCRDKLPLLTVLYPKLYSTLLYLKMSLMPPTSVSVTGTASCDFTGDPAFHVRRSSPFLSFPFLSFHLLYSPNITARDTRRDRRSLRGSEEWSVGHNSYTHRTRSPRRDS